MVQQLLVRPEHREQHRVGRLRTAVWELKLHKKPPQLGQHVHEQQTLLEELADQPLELQETQRPFAPGRLPRVRERLLARLYPALLRALELPRDHRPERPE